MNNYEDKTDDRKETGGMAFARPTSQAPNDEIAWDQQGMTLRDYFAAKAMQGLLSNPQVIIFNENRAEQAYELADAMLKERDKEE